MTKLVIPERARHADRSEELVVVISPALDRREVHTIANARDLVRAGWLQTSDDVCEVCFGLGHDKHGEQCWHCDGEGINPA